MDWLDHKYISLAAPHLSQFKQKNGLYNFRCPFCGDSKKSRTKARGFIVETKGKVFYKCHNCSIAAPFFKLLSHLNAELADQYRTDRFKEKHGDVPRKQKLFEKVPDITSTAKPVFIKYSPLKDLKKISQLRPDHPVKQYVQKRLIPSNFHYKLFYAPMFKQWVNTFIPDKFDVSTPDEPRLVIPLLDSYGNLIGIQGRNFSQKGTRYITIIVDESKPKLYGLDHTNVNKITYVFEGPIDSMFVPNSIAMAGADCVAALRQAGIDQSNVVLCYDNEPRNKEICNRIEKMIDLGFKVLLWPSHITHKDVNDMVIAGVKPADIKLIIDNNTFSGLEAKLQFTIWRKC